MNRGVIAPQCTPKKYDAKKVGASGAASKEVSREYAPPPSLSRPCLDYSHNLAQP